MRVRIKRYPRNAEAGVDDNVGPGDEVADVSATPFAVVGGASGLLSALSAILTFMLMTKPDADVRRGVSAGEAQVQMLQQALQVESAEGRKTSVQLLRAMGLLRARDEGRLNSLLASVDSLPRWPAAGEESDADASASNDPADNGGGKAAEGTGGTRQGNRQPAPAQQGLNPETGGTGT
jgi:hypothetical protein